MSDLQQDLLVAQRPIGSERIHVRLMRSNALHAAHAFALRRLPALPQLRAGLASNAIVLAAEHHAAICLLIAQAHYSTAHALGRTLIETTMRAAWLSYLAPWDQVQIVADRQTSPDLDKICRDITKSKHPSLAPIAEAVLDIRGIFHSFAHAGAEQLVRRVRGYSEKEVLTLLMLADTFACIAIANVAELYDDDDVRKLSMSHGFPLAMESHFEYGNPRPAADWDGRLPKCPTWSDPR